MVAKPLVVPIMESGLLLSRAFTVIAVPVALLVVIVVELPRVKLLVFMVRRLVLVALIEVELAILMLVEVITTRPLRPGLRV